MKSSETPLQTITIDDQNSWLYSLIGQGEQSKKKFSLDDDFKVTRDRNSKHVVMFMVVSVDNSHLQEEESEEEEEGEEEGEDEEIDDGGQDKERVELR